jgi:hypothetical protein
VIYRSTLVINIVVYILVISQLAYYIVSMAAGCVVASV